MRKKLSVMIASAALLAVAFWPPATLATAAETNRPRPSNTAAVRLLLEGESRRIIALGLRENIIRVGIIEFFRFGRGWGFGEGKTRNGGSEAEEAGRQQKKIGAAGAGKGKGGRAGKLKD